MKLLFIDHHDSFSNNIISFFRSKNCDVTIISYSHVFPKHINLQRYRAILLSPGPGHPKDYPKTIEFYNLLPKNIPVLGICLGLQILLYASGGNIVQISDIPIHGRQKKMKTFLRSRILGKMQLKGTIVLYHSFGFRTDDPVFDTWNTLLDADHVCLMAEHRSHPHIGMQFHPESFASTAGPSLLDTFIRSLKKC